MSNKGVYQIDIPIARQIWAEQGKEELQQALIAYLEWKKKTIHKLDIVLDGWTIQAVVLSNNDVSATLTSHSELSAFLTGYYYGLITGYMYSVKKDNCNNKEEEQ